MSSGIPPFDTWLDEYLRFRKDAAVYVSRPIPTDLAALHEEAQRLEPLYERAESQRAMAECQMRVAVERGQKDRARVVWALEDANGRCRVISSRSLKVAQQIKIQDQQAGGKPWNRLSGQHG